MNTHGRIDGRVHGYTGRVHGPYTAIDTARTRPCTSVHGRGHGPCTWPYTPPVHGPCTRPCLRPVHGRGTSGTRRVHSLVHGPVYMGCVHGRVHGLYTALYTIVYTAHMHGRVHVYTARTFSQTVVITPVNKTKHHFAFHRKFIKYGVKRHLG